MEGQLKLSLETEVLVDAIIALSTFSGSTGAWAWRWHPPTALLRQAGLSSQGSIPLPCSTTLLPGWGRQV